MLDRKTTGEIDLLDEVLDSIRELSTELSKTNKNYRLAHESLYKNLEEENKNLGRDIRDDGNCDLRTRLLAGYVIASNIRSMMLFNYHGIVASNFEILSAKLEFVVASIANELSQLKQKTPSKAFAKKTLEVENRIAELNKDFEKYGPMLRKFKRALDQTERTLRDNR